MGIEVLTPLILTAESVGSLALALFLLYRYGNIRRQNPLVTIVTLTVWFLSFFIIFLLPIDVSSAFYNDCLEQASINESNCNGTTSDQACNCKALVCNVHNFPAAFEQQCSDHCPVGHYAFICQQPITILWYIIYWSFTLLTWLVLPLVQSYVMASYFSIKKKILRVIIENIVFYISLLVVFVIVLISLLVQHVITIGDIPTLIATVCNTWGLLVLTVLLGYGLVEVPRSLWNASRRQWTLNYCYFKAAKVYADMCESTHTLKEMKEKVRTLSQDTHYRHPMRKYVDLIIKKFPEEMRSVFNQGHDDFEDFKDDSTEVLTKKSLEDIYQKTIKSVRLKHRTTVEWADLTDRALDLEDTFINATSSSRKFISSVRRRRSGIIFKLFYMLEWYWKVKIRDWVLKSIAIILFIFTIVIVWSEGTFGIPLPNRQHLSIIANVVYAAHNNANYVIVELTSIITVAYLSLCAYFTVFKIRIFNFYYLAPRHSTDEYSLLFSAMLLSRLALPICLNYLYVINVVDLQLEHTDVVGVPQTAFQMAAGNTALIPWITKGFNIYYPIIIVLICLATFFKLGQRLMSLCGYETFIGEDAFSADHIDEGKALIKRERRLREGALQSGDLRRKLQSGAIAEAVMSEAGPSSFKPASKDTSNTQTFLKSFERFKKGNGKKGSSSEINSTPRYFRNEANGRDEDEDTTNLISRDSLDRSSNYYDRDNLFDDI